MLSPRRYYLRKWRELEESCEHELALLFRAKQLGESSTPFPAGFPGAETLNGAGYLAFEDVFGAEIDELIELGLDEPTAARAIDAAQTESAP